MALVNTLITINLSNIRGTYVKCNCIPLTFMRIVLRDLSDLIKIKLIFQCKFFKVRISSS